MSCNLGFGGSLGHQINRRLTAQKRAEGVLAIVDRHLAQFTIVNMSTALHRVAQCSGGTLTSADPRLSALLRAAQLEADYLRPRDISNISWAVASLELKDSPLLSALAQRARQSSASCEAQNISNTAWAYAKRNVRDDPLCAALASQALRRLNDFITLNLANTAWAFAKLGVDHVPLLTAIAASARPRLTEFDQQGRSNLAWAYSKCVFVHEPLLDAIAAESIPKIKSQSCQNLANLAWAYSLLSLPHEPLLQSLAASSRPRIRDFDAQELANTAWAFASMHVAYHAQSLSSTAWSQSALGLRHAPLMESIAAASRSTISQAAPLDAGGNFGASRAGRPRVAAGLGALLWSLWRADQWSVEWASLAGMEGAVDCGVLWMDLLGRRATSQAFRAWSALEVATGVRCLTCRLPPDRCLIPRYRKVAALVAHTAGVAADSVDALLESIEVFAALSVGQWLKVAGGAKAEVLVAARSGAAGVGLDVELGAFVGYTAMRLAGRGVPLATLEQDPVHLAVARWHLNQAGLLLLAEVLPGRVVDSLPGVLEAGGGRSVPFIFMDQGGSGFASDMAHSERLSSPCPGGRLAADNVLRPGAPAFAARVLRGSARALACAWSLPEFLEERHGIEDWMVVLG